MFKRYKNMGRFKQHLFLNIQIYKQIFKYPNTFGDLYMLPTFRTRKLWNMKTTLQQQLCSLDVVYKASSFTGTSNFNLHNYYVSCSLDHLKSSSYYIVFWFSLYIHIHRLLVLTVYTHILNILHSCLVLTVYTHILIFKCKLVSTD